MSQFQTSSVVMTGDAAPDAITIDLNGNLLQHNVLTPPPGQFYADNLDFNSTDISPISSQHVGNGGLPVTINGGGNDLIALGLAPATPVSAFLTSFTVNGLAGGNDRLTLDNQSDATARTVTITSNSVSFSGGPTISYSNLKLLRIFGVNQDFQVQSTPAGMTLDLENTGPALDQVTVGAAGSTQNVLGPVNLTSVGGSFALTVDDSADLNPTSPVLTTTDLTGLNPGGIQFGSSNQSSVTIDLGAQGNTVTVAGTPAAPTTINEGAGNDQTFVQRATVGLTINGGGGTDQVFVGNAGILSQIQGPLNIQNTGGKTALTVDDSADTTGRNATLKAVAQTGFLDGLNPLGITYTTFEISSLNLKAGLGDDSLTVDFSNDPPIDTNLPLQYDGGAGNNSLVLTGGAPLNFQNETYTATGPASGLIDIDGRKITYSHLLPITDTLPIHNDFTFNAPDSVNALQIVDGPLVNGVQTAQIASTDNPAHFGSLSFANKIVNVIINAPATATSTLAQTILLNNPTPATGQTNLQINAGAGANVLTVAATPAGIATVINTGTGASTVSIQGTNGPLTINGQGGSNQIVLGNSGSLLGILGTVTLQNSASNDSVTLDDSGDTTSRTFTVTGAAISATGGPTVNFGGVSKLKLIGTNQDMVVASLHVGTALTLVNSGAVPDRVTVGAAGLTQNVLGPVNLVSQGGAFQLTVDDPADQSSTTAILSTTSLTGLAPGGITFGAATFTTFTINECACGNNAVVTGTPSGSVVLNSGAGADTVSVQGTNGPLTVNGIGGTDQVTVGNAGSLLGIGGPLVIENTGGKTNLTVDDSADQTGRNATLSAAPGGATLVGLSPQPIQYLVSDLNAVNIKGGLGADSLAVDFSAGAPITPTLGLTYDGGAGGNTLALQGGSFNNEVYTASGPGAGSISLDGALVTFTNLRPIIDTAPASNFTFNAPAGAQAFNIVNVPPVNGANTQIASGDTPAAFELVDFANKSNVTVNTAAQDPSGVNVNKSVVVNDPVPAPGLADLTVTTGQGNDYVTIQATPAGVKSSITTGGGTDTVDVLASGLGAGGSDTVDGGPGNVQLNVDAGGGALKPDPPNAGVVAITGDTPLNYTNVRLLVNIFNVADKPLTPVSQTLNATPNQTLTDVVVGSFNDADLRSQPGDFTGQINWGDGTTSAVTSITRNLSGGYDVHGTHTFLQPGTFTVAATIADNGSSSTTNNPPVPVKISDPGGQTTTIISQAQVNPASIGGTGIPINAVEDVPFNGQVATFASRVFLVPGTFTATIDWGDQSSSPGQVVAANGTATVSGSHTYSTQDTYTVLVTLNFTTTRGATVTGQATTTATVAENFTVTNTQDSGSGSLRNLIEDLNSDKTGGHITFNIPGPGPYVIHVASPLPATLFPVTIDGTRPGFGNRPMVVIRGDQLVGDGDGLTIAGGNSTVTGLVIDGFANGVGLVLEGPGGNTVVNNYIGTDASGTIRVPNYQGVLIEGSNGNTIGGTGPGAGNLISGNLSAGVQIINTQSVNDPAVPIPSIGLATGNLIAGNLIGTDVSESARVGNGQGVFINDASGNVVSGNVIAGNATIGVQVLGPDATGNALSANEIGTNRNHAPGLGNTVGVYIYAGSGNVLAPQSNDIAFNSQAGMATRLLASGPQVEGVLALRNASGAITGLRLTFTTYLDRGRAMNPRNYFVNLLGNNLRPGRNIPVVSAPYNGVNRTVELSLASPIAANLTFQLRVVGASPLGLTDQRLNPLDGSGIDPAPVGGSDALIYFRNGAPVDLVPTPVKRGRGSNHRPRRHGHSAPSAAAVDALFGAGNPLSRHVRSTH